MTLVVYTARITYAGEDRLDVTRKSGCELGIVFAPSWAILRPALQVRRNASLLRVEANIDLAKRIEERCWNEYVPKYLEEMRDSYRLNRAAWDELLSRERVTLCCYCARPRRCHRRLLSEILGKLGAEVHGEVPC